MLPVPSRFFGGNIAVTGLLTGADLAGALAGCADRPPVPPPPTSPSRTAGSSTASRPPTCRARSTSWPPTARHSWKPWSNEPARRRRRRPPECRQVHPREPHRRSP
ncbi:MAG: DUF512 domain-containing protein [Acidimicrobiia bacterium]